MHKIVPHNKGLSGLKCQESWDWKTGYRPMLIFGLLKLTLKNIYSSMKVWAIGVYSFQKVTQGESK